MKFILIFVISISMLYGEALIQPIEEIKNINYKKAELGQALFFDPSLSKDKTISCASCHKTEHGWADDKRISIGVYGRKGKINSPTVLNAIYNFKQFWNGRVDTLYQQASGPLHQSFEMDIDKDTLQERLNHNLTYKAMFKEIYHKDVIVYKDIIDAIVEFEKTLTTPDSKFDRYLKHEISLSPLEKKGYTLFKMYGCITCHNGINVGGNSFQKIGIVINYKDCFLDRYEVTKKPFDKCVYKVPSLRNISKTAPYFHDGRARTLKDAISIMALHNLGFEIEEGDLKAIEAFLKTLDADLTQKENK